MPSGCSGIDAFAASYTVSAGGEIRKQEDISTSYAEKPRNMVIESNMMAYGLERLSSGQQRTAE